MQAQKEAAAIFGAEKTYFVLNGTSTSNKIVLTNLVAEDDLVLFDRNNHKAAHHGALLIGGGVPIFLPADRNAHGLIGPIRADAFDEAAIRERIRANPLVKDPEAWKRERPFRVAVIEQCTYDGTIYDAERIVQRIGHLCDYILFDEAWAGFMKFHPLYERRFAMGLKNLGEASPGVVATQSAHKQLASFSQASQIHVRDRHIKGQRRRVEHRRFNEGFMQHASTSPFYPLFASLDVGAQMMKGRSGEVLWDDTIRLGIELRKKLRAVRREFEEKEKDPARRWFFDPFVPDRVSIPDVASGGGAHVVPWESVSTDLLARDPRFWALAPGEAWHGFSQLEAGFAITDPAKLTLLTPGFDRRTGAYEAHGVPAPVVAQYLRENRVVPEKNDLNSLLFLLTPGVEFEQGRHAGLGAGRLQAPARRQRPAGGRDAGIRRAPPRALSRQAPARPLRRNARLFPRGRRQRVAEGAVRARASAGDGHDAARGLAPSRAQQRRLPLPRRARRAGRDDLVRRLSPRDRDDRSRRAARRARPADDRLPQDVRARRQRLPRIRSRNTRSLSRNRRVGRDSLLHLCRARIEARASRAGAPMTMQDVDKASTARRRAAPLVRPSREADVPAMLAIYLHHIRHGVDPTPPATSRRPTPTTSERRRKTMHRGRLPHLVAERAGVVVGYAYAVPFRKRPAYRYAVKHSIYVHHEHLGRGVGRLLLAALIDACAAAGYRQMIGYIDAANQASLRLHESFGFRQVGHLPTIGYKFGRWTDSVMVQRSLGLGATAAPEG